MSLSSDWAQSQRNGWLCYLYGEDTGTGTKELPAQSIQSQLVTILSNLIDKELSPTECATKTAVLLRDESDFRGFCNNLWGMYFGAVEHFASEDVLQALVYYIVALAQLPDAMNDGHDEGLWKDLPDFKLNLVERFQGPEQYTRKHTSPASPESAAATWLNMNVWTELMARNEDAQEFGDLAGYAVLGLQTLIMALEHSPETRRD
ncbi:hypothetical protein B0A50_08351 [Salinomyces thailandicus]|uniref:Uncharacterized protein n=1 Tax=Salinomyces thailandicus TaxID=706561 RepID=A0A4U0TKN3_9PEZI|nr:hypothetical protein B0A50_08351 [Salinomyces thailandica]